MSREEKQQSQQAELQKQLWSIANSLRGNMDANDFKNYILGLIFYRYLSENLVNYVENVMLRNKMKYADMFKDKEQAQEFKSDLIEEENIGYCIEPEYLWSTLIDNIKTGKFDISMLSKAINSISDISTFVSLSNLSISGSRFSEWVFSSIIFNSFIQTSLSSKATEQTLLEVEIAKIFIKITP